MKTSAKKGQEKPKFVKKRVRQKIAYQVANFCFALKFHTILV